MGRCELDECYETKRVDCVWRRGTTSLSNNFNNIEEFDWSRAPLKRDIIWCYQ